MIGKRKPDGLYADPTTGRPPLVYLEIKNVRRVADDIQKRIYEIAEASLEMKLLYGNLSLQGLGVTSALNVADRTEDLRLAIRSQILNSRPTIVALVLCPQSEAERYRAGAETFVDRILFQEEIEECLAFLRSTIAADDGP